MTQKEQYNATGFLENMIARVDSPEHAPIMQKKEIVKGLERTMQELSALREFDIREVGDHVNDGIYISDGNEKTLYVNKAYTRMTGIRAKEVIGKKVSNLVKEGMYKYAVTPEVIRLKKQVNTVGEGYRKGTKMLISGDPVLDEAGNVKMVIVTTREITELLAMQAELEESQRKIKAVEAGQSKNQLEIEHLRKLHLSSNLIGKSAAIQQVINMVHQIAELDVTVLITGETGSGKEVVANEIYMNSTRKNGPYIKVNCAAIPANLLEAELFGYDKGAFTGAISTGKLGMFELADKGTLMLDEIGDMPMELQSKLLRVIQHKEITRIGGRKPIKLDTRIISATNCDLLELVRQGRFREDLFYRLNVFPIYIPPLRLRLEDIEVLAEHFLRISNTMYGKHVAFDRPIIETLKQYSWPGNIRELQNIVERLVIICAPGAGISVEQVGNLLNIDPYYTELLNKEMGLKEIVEDVEKRTIEKALSHCGSTRKAAKVLGIDQSTIVKKAKKLGIRLSAEQ
jgi:PAS domain S-box-containing protein